MLNNFLSKLYRQYKEFQKTSHDLTNVLMNINFDRLSIIGYIAVPVHALHIILFWNFTGNGTQNEIYWRNGIILSHAVLLIYMTGLILVTRYFSGHRRNLRVMQITLWATLIVILLAGIAIVTIDQLITTNITPFLLIYVITAMVFLIPSVQAFFLYVVTYGIYVWAIGLTQTDPAVLLSNRVNGLTSVGVATALSIILWRSMVITKSQERLLKQQKRKLEEQNAQLSEYAFFDPLTGLYNRRIFYELISKEEEKMMRENTWAVFLILDIDHFKQINDKYGHYAGDKVLENIGKVLSTRLRKEDIVCRLGGEEFLCCLMKPRLSEIGAIAESLRKTIEEMEIEVGQARIKVTASIGLSVLAPAENIKFKQAYKNADDALYLAKESGRNRVEIHPSVLTYQSKAEKE